MTTATIHDTPTTAIRRAGGLCLAGATVQLGYGALAVVRPYPTITEAPYELLWAVVNLGMVAGVIGLALLLQPAHPKAAIVGGASAAAGHLARGVVSVLLAVGVLDAGAGVDTAVMVSILGMFVGMGILAGAAVRRPGLWAGWRTHLPSLIVATGLITAVVYSIDLVAHFVTLGLWGVPWLLLGAALRRSASAPPARAR